jgi:hypothetical protein
MSITDLEEAGIMLEGVKRACESMIDVFTSRAKGEKYC